MIKKMLLTSIAALLLATGAAHATEEVDTTPRGSAPAHDACVEGNQEACEVAERMDKQQTPPLPPDSIEGPMCPAPQDKMGNPTEIPCDELGVAYDCGQSPHGTEAGEPDLVWIKHGHIYSDLNSQTITIYLPSRASRMRRPYPVIRYDLENNEITLDGKPCHPVGG